MLVAFKPSCLAVFIRLRTTVSQANWFNKPRVLVSKIVRLENEFITALEHFDTMFCSWMLERFIQSEYSMLYSRVFPRRGYYPTFKPGILHKAENQIHSICQITTNF